LGVGVARPSGCLWNEYCHVGFRCMLALRIFAFVSLAFMSFRTVVFVLRRQRRISGHLSQFSYQAEAD